ncbi:hypothetical protein [Streptacidiphilus anmyonensis]|uniref:hypothetical protein n=1 Tax=Streptacidiphilus anmyonensis TaxID=405782 RepID=UPI0005A9D962|nr:hypothetical protein [Streptacidiphilus anmyonensis]
MTLYSEPNFSGTSRRLRDTGWTAYSLVALGLERIGSVRVVSSASGGRQDPAARVFRAQLYDWAPVYLGSGADARRHRLDVTADRADTGDWADRVRYVTVASCPATDADWGLDWKLAAGEPVRYTLVEQPPASDEGLGSATTAGTAAREDKPGAPPEGSLTDDD